MSSKHSLVVFVVPSLGRPVVISISRVIIRRLVVIIILGSFRSRRLAVMIAIITVIVIPVIPIVHIGIRCRACVHIWS